MDDLHTLIGEGFPRLVGKASGEGDLLRIELELIVVLVERFVLGHLMYLLRVSGINVPMITTM